MGIKDLFNDKPRVKPIRLPKFMVVGEAAATVREIRKAIGGNVPMEEIILALIDEGAKAYRQMKADNNDAKPVPQEPDPKA